MESLDVKDRKILYHLDLDSRQSFSSIGRKVDLSKNVVASRVKKLQEKGIIKNFFTLIDTSKLGYAYIRIYLVYERVTPEVRAEIIDYFVKNEYSWVVCSLSGKYDFASVIWIKDINDFFYFWKHTLEKYRNYIREQLFSIFQHTFYRYSFLMADIYDTIDRSWSRTIGGGGHVEIDDKDFQILTLLAPNARIPTKDIAKQLNISTITVKNRIKRLTELKVIQGYKVDLDFLKIGYYYFKAGINLFNYHKRKKLLCYLIENPNLIMIDESAGFY